MKDYNNTRLNHSIKSQPTYKKKKKIIIIKRPTIQSITIQTIKNISKLIKIIKGQLIQKCTRKLKDLELCISLTATNNTACNNTKLELYEKELIILKRLNHQTIATYIINNQNTTDITNSNNFTIDELNYIQKHILNHTKVKDALSIYDSKLSAVKAENEARINASMSKSNGERTSKHREVISSQVLVY